MVRGPVLADLKRAGIDAVGRPERVGGGSIGRALRLPSSAGPVLLKTRSADGLDAFEAEVDALESLRRANAVAVPAVLAWGSAGGEAYLALEWIEFGAKTGAVQGRLGRELAELHRRSAAEFGWHRDNYIGATPQRNPRSRDWPRFFRDARLGPQCDLARRNGLPEDCARLGAELLAGLDCFFDGHAPAPSLLHGDLWGGNWGATPAGVPYLYDPAAYFGDREADLAMTRLFGGFGPEFYRAYDEAWPLPDGAERRADLYNLYHLLNHFNLFGPAYLGQVTAALRSLVRRV